MIFELVSSRTPQITSSSIKQGKPGLARPRLKLNSPGFVPFHWKAKRLKHRSLARRDLGPPEVPEAFSRGKPRSRQLLSTLTVLHPLAMEPEYSILQLSSSRTPTARRVDPKTLLTQFQKVVN